MNSNSVQYDCSIAASLLIVEMIQTSPHVTTPEMVSFCTFTILEAIYEAQGGWGKDAPSPA